MSAEQLQCDASMLAAALRYARAGIPIFPCRLDKKPYTDHGFKEATCDEQQLREWWERWPAASVGMPTGATSGRFVLDVDPRHAGDKSLAELQAKYGTLPRTLQSKTGGGGTHLFYWSRGLEIRNSSGFLGPGLDVRARGGYVILPPSPHASGDRYAWIEEGAREIVDAPDWLTGLLLQPSAPANGNGAGEKVPAGQRNARLASFAGALRRAGHTVAEIEAKLSAFNVAHCEPPLAESEVVKIANSISRYEPAREEIPGRIPVTETSNAERLVAKYATDLRYSSDRGVWCVWNGAFWGVNDQGAMMRCVQEVARDVYREAANEPNETLRKALAGWARQSDSRRTQENAAAIARYFEGVEIRNFADVFDANPFLLNAKNGTIDLRTGELHAHRREDFLTKIVPFDYDPKAGCPRFSKFLDETFEQAGMVGYLSRVMGYFLSGLTSEQCWWLFHGGTATGKSTLIRILHGLLGPYAHALPEGFFLATKNASDFATAKLAGVRLATCVETNEGRRLDVAKIKMLTGEDAVTAALKYENSFTFRVESKLVLVTNHAPQVPAGDDAIWRRIRVVRFQRQPVTEGGRIDDLAEQLVEQEGSGILRLAVLGSQARSLGGLQEPAAVTNAVAEYRAAEDVIQNFFDDSCVTDRGARVLRKEFYAAYAKWSGENGLRPMTAKKLGMELQRLGIKGDPGDRHWLDVRLADPFSEACGGNS